MALVRLLDEWHWQVFSFWVAVGDTLYRFHALGQRSFAMTGVSTRSVTVVGGGRLLILRLEGAQDVPADSNPAADNPHELPLMAVGTKLLLSGS